MNAWKRLPLLLACAALPAATAPAGHRDLGTETLAVGDARSQRTISGVGAGITRP